MKPLECGEVRAVLERFTAGKLPAVEAGRVEAHLYLCDGCAEELAGLAATAEPGRAWREPLRALLGGRGFIWRSAAWQLGAIESAFRRGWETARVARGLPVTRGLAMERGAPADTPVHMVDAQWRVTAIPPVAGVVTSPAVLTADGEFRAEIRLPNAPAAAFDGRAMVCILKLEDGSWVGFEAVVRDGAAQFSAAGLPVLVRAAMPPGSALEFYLAPAAEDGA
jgi:hypothetical protein